MTFLSDTRITIRSLPYGPKQFLAIRKMIIQRHHLISFVTEKVQAWGRAVSWANSQDANITQEPKLELTLGRIGCPFFLTLWTLLTLISNSTKELYTMGQDESRLWQPCPQSPQGKIMSWKCKLTLYGEKRNCSTLETQDKAWPNSKGNKIKFLSHIENKIYKIKL